VPNGETGEITFNVCRRTFMPLSSCNVSLIAPAAHRFARVSLAIVLDVRDPATGKRKRKWDSFRGTKRQAQIESARLISELQGGGYLEPTKTTFVQFLDQWLGHIKVHVSPRTHERYTEIIRKNIAPMLGAVRLTKLRPAQGMSR
jgi:Phage integrase, N-terminal SAM-like domain